VYVRPATVNDAESIADIHVRSWQAAYVGQVPKDYLDGLSVDDRVRTWRQMLGQLDCSRSGVFVLVDGDEVDGFTGFGPSRDDDAAGDVGEVASIYLAPERWGQGCGRMLIEAAAERLRDASFATATLWVLRTNTRARRFYEAAGWRPDGKEMTDSSRGFPLIETRYCRRL